MITLGTASTAERASRTHAFPIRFVAIAGGEVLQRAGRCDRIPFTIQNGKAAIENLSRKLNGWFFGRQMDNRRDFPLKNGGYISTITSISNPNEIRNDFSHTMNQLSEDW